MEIVSWLTMAVTVASAVAATTPTPKDDAFVAKLYYFVDLFALNVGKAKEKGEAPPAPAAPAVEEKGGK